MKMSNFLAKLRSLSDTKKKAIIITVVAVSILVMGFFWLRLAGVNLSKMGESLRSVNLPVVNLPKIDLPSIPDISQDQMADWETYTSQQYGFEFKYPAANVIPASANNLIELSLGIGTMTFNLSDEKINNGALISSYFGEIKDPIIIMVGQKNAYQYTIDQDGCRGYLTVMPVKEKMLEINLNNCGAGAVQDPSFPDSQLSLMNQILATLTFTSPVSTSDWKTYRNEDEGFEIKYPAPENVNLITVWKNEYIKANFIDFQMYINEPMFNIGIDHHIENNPELTIEPFCYSEDGKNLPVEVIDGVTFEKKFCDPYLYYQVTYHDRPYRIFVYDVSLNDQEELQKISSIVSTFKFTN